MIDIKRLGKKILQIYEKILSSPALLAIFALCFAHFLYYSTDTVIISTVAAAFLYSIKHKKFPVSASFKYAGVFGGLQMLITIGQAFYITAKQLDWAPIFTIIKVIFIIPFVFIISFLAFYLSNIIITLVLRLFSKVKFLNKVNEFFDFLFINSPKYLFATLLVIFIFINILQIFTMAGGTFVQTKGPKIGMGNKVPAMPIDKDKAVVIQQEQDGAEYSIFDSSKGKIIKDGSLNFEYKYNSQAAKINDYEILIITPKDSILSDNRHKCDKVKLGILNLKDFKFKNLGLFDINMNFAYGIAPIGNNEILITGGAGHDKQAYIFKNEKLIKISNLNNGYIEPKIIPFKNGKYLIVGNSSNKKYIETFDPKTRTFNVVFETNSTDENNITLKETYFIEKYNKIAIIGTYRKPDEKYTNVYRFSKIIFLDADTFKKTAENDFEFKGQLHDENQIIQLQNGNLFITGGTKGEPSIKNLNNYNKRAYIYDFKTSTLKPVKSKIKSNRTKGQALLLNNGRILILGGSKGEWNIEEMDMYIP